MVVDVHSHTWRYPEHFSAEFRHQAFLARGREVDLSTHKEQYLQSAKAVDRVIVFGGKARLSGLWIPDDFVADYVQEMGEKAIGFLSVDPTQEGWEDELRYGHQELQLVGVKLLPMYAGFYPHDPKLDPLWEYCQTNGLPVLLHTGTTFVSQAPLDCTLPRHIDDVARRFPELRLVMAHLGHPYEGECIAVIRKHPHVYADVSALFYRPYQLYHSLMLVQEYGVWHKLLFGSDYPFATVDESIAGLLSLNDQLEGSSLPRLSMEEIQGVIQRDALSLLGLK